MQAGRSDRTHFNVRTGGIEMTTQILKQLCQILLFGIVMVFIQLTPSSAQSAIVERVAKNCRAELDNYCRKVTLGEGRIASCLYAHNDKLSDQCADAIDESLDQLANILSTVRYVAEQCKADMGKHCAGTEVGGYRVYSCLIKHEVNLEAQCKTALSEAEKVLK